MIIYESKRFGAKNEVEIVNPHVEDYNIRHFHRSFEFIYVCEEKGEGELSVYIDNTEVTLTGGEFILIFPKQLHFFTAKTTSRKILAMFSPNYISSFYQQYQNKLPKKQVFKLDDSLKSLIENNLTKNADSFMLSACMYAICSQICAESEFYDIDTKVDLNLAHKILTYIEENFKSNINLSDISQALGYNYHYICRECYKLLNVTYIELLNTYRLDHAVNQLITTKKTITTVAYESGFDNIRTFNRNFIKTYGVTPKEYRKNYVEPKIL